MTKSKFRNTIVLFFLIFTLLIVSYMYYMDNNTYSVLNLTIVFSLFLFSLLNFIMKKETFGILNRQYLKASNLFLLGFTIVHFQFYLDLILGNFDINRQDLIINKDIIIKSSIISTISFITFCIGYQYKMNKNSHLNFKENKRSKFLNLNFLKVLIILLFLAFITLTPLSYFKSGYISTELSSLSLNSQNLLIVSIIVYLILNVRNIFILKKQVKNFLEYIKETGFLITSIIIFYCFLVMISGDRGPILQIVLSYVASYFILQRKKINILTVLSTVFIGAFFISFIGYFRNLKGGGNISEMVEQTIISRESVVSNKRSFSPETFELSKSVRVMHASVSHTEKYGHTNGFFQIFQIIGILPGFGSIIKKITGVDNKMYKSSNFLTNEIGEDHGLGTTVIADIWLDFGLIGILFILFYFGYFLRLIDEYMYSHLTLNAFWYVLIIVFISKSFYIGRSTIIDVFRETSLGFIVLIIGVYIPNFINKKKH